MSIFIKTSTADGVLSIMLDRPSKKNAITSQMYEAMIGALDKASMDESIGAVLFLGNEGVFTAGNDIQDFLSHIGSGAQNLAALQFIRALAVFEKPMVAAVDGLAIGVGTTMLLHCDLVYATELAQFRMNFIDLGLVPEAASSLLLPQAIGLQKASEYLLLGDGFSAAEALRLGLVNSLLAPADVGFHAKRQAIRLASKPRHSLAATRRLIRGDREVISSRIEVEALLFGAALQSPEAHAAMSAFVNKTK
jgi:enoyl-CoA hydratase/carnithine racemase